MWMGGSLEENLWYRQSLYICKIIEVKQSLYRPGVAQKGSRKLCLPDFMTTARMVVRLSALRTGRLYPQEIHLELISVRG